MAASTKGGGITYEEIVRNLKAGKVAPVYFLMGEEGYYIDKLSDLLVETILKPEDKDFNLDVVYGIDVTVDQIIDLARTYPMMSDHRVVLVREAQGLRSLDGLEKYVEHVTESTILVICYKNGAADRRKAVLKAIAQYGILFESKRLYDRQLPGFIIGYLRQCGVEVENEAVQMLADHVGADLCRLSAEMDKLLLLVKKGERITSAMVEEQTGMSKDFNNFELQNAIACRDVFRANRIVRYYQSNPRNFALPVTLSNLFTFFSDVMMSYYSPDKTEEGIALWLSVPLWKLKQDILPAKKNYSGVKVMFILSEIRKTDAASKGVEGNSATPGELLQDLIYYILH